MALRSVLRKFTVAQAVAFGVLASAGIAFAAWLPPTGSGSGKANGYTLGTPGTGTATPATPTSMNLTWVDVSRPTGVGYKVLRSSDGGTTYSAVTAGGCAAPVGTNSCTDNSGLSAGHAYSYKVEVAVQGWTGPTSNFSGTTLAADGSGSLGVSPTSVLAASTGNTLTFTYTAATGGISGGAVTVTVPSGWSAPSTTGTNAGYSTASTGTLSVNGQVITVSGVALSSGGTLAIVYGSKAASGPGATATSSTGSQTWQGQEKSSSGGTLTNVSSSPSVSVSNSADGSGTMSVSPTTVTPSTAGQTLTFTYTASTGGISSGAVTVTVPSGWNQPSTSSSNAGYSTASTGTLSASGQVITVSGVSLSKGQTLTIVYGSTAGTGSGATSPSTTGSQTWQTQEKSTSGGTLTNLGSSPSVTVRGISVSPSDPRKNKTDTVTVSGGGFAANSQLTASLSSGSITTNVSVTTDSSGNIPSGTTFVMTNPNSSPTVVTVTVTDASNNSAQATFTTTS